MHSIWARVAFSASLAYSSGPALPYSINIANYGPASPTYSLDLCILWLTSSLYMSLPPGKSTWLFRARRNRTCKRIGLVKFGWRCWLDLRTPLTSGIPVRWFGYSFISFCFVSDLYIFLYILLFFTSTGFLLFSVFVTLVRGHSSRYICIVCAFWFL